MIPSYGSDTTSKEIAAGLREFLGEQCSLEHVRRNWTEGDFDRALWQELASLGLGGALVAEAEGGLGLRAEDIVLALEEFGYSGASLPLVDTVAVVVPIVERYAGEDLRADLLPGLIGGELIGATTVMTGGGRAPFAADADVLLFEWEGDLYALRRGEFDTEPVHTPDPASRVVRVRVREGVLTDSRRLGEGAAADAEQRAVWAAAAVLNGVSRRMLDLLVEHAKTREQFGRVIGAFQAVKHLAADAWVAIESSRPCSWYAAFSSGERLPDADAAASIAKAAASDAARLVGDSALQIHGGIGFTWEHPLHFWMKRGKLLENIYGSRQFHLQRLGAVMRDERDGSEAIFADI